MAYGREETVELVLPSPAKFLTPAVVTFLLLIITGSVVLSYWKEFAIGTLALNPAGGVLRGRVWQLFTYPFVDAGWPMVWNGLCILLFGSALEREWGTRSIFFIWFLVAFMCALIWIVISLLAGREFIGYSSDSATYGILGAFGLAFRRRRFMFIFWGMEAQYIVLLLIVIGLVLGIPNPITWIWVAGAGVGCLYLKLVWWMRQGWGARQAVDRGRFKDLG